MPVTYDTISVIRALQTPMHFTKFARSSALEADCHSVGWDWRHRGQIVFQITIGP